MIRTFWLVIVSFFFLYFKILYKQKNFNKHVFWTYSTFHWAIREHSGVLIDGDTVTVKYEI